MAETQQAKSGTKLYISNILFTIQEKPFRQAFQAYGNIINLSLKKKQKNVTYAFIQYDTPQSAQLAIQKMNNVQLFGRKLNVQYGKGQRRRYQRVSQRPRDHNNRGQRDSPRSYDRQRRSSSYRSSSSSSSRKSYNRYKYADSKERQRFLRSDRFNNRRKQRQYQRSKSFQNEKRHKGYSKDRSPDKHYLIQQNYSPYESKNRSYISSQPRREVNRFDTHSPIFDYKNKQNPHQNSYRSKQFEKKRKYSRQSSQKANKTQKQYPKAYDRYEVITKNKLTQRQSPSKNYNKNRYQEKNDRSYQRQYRNRQFDQPKGSQGINKQYNKFQYNHERYEKDYRNHRKDDFRNQKSDDSIHKRRERDYSIQNSRYEGRYQSRHQSRHGRRDERRDDRRDDRREDRSYDRRDGRRDDSREGRREDRRSNYRQERRTEDFSSRNNQQIHNEKYGKDEYKSKHFEKRQRSRQIEKYEQRRDYKRQSNQKGYRSDRYNREKGDYQSSKFDKNKGNNHNSYDYKTNYQNGDKIQKVQSENQRRNSAHYSDDLAKDKSSLRKQESMARQNFISK